MTDDITLPTTPNRTLLRRVMPDDYRYGDIYGYTVEQMRSYARAAVEADRQSRGEPVGYFQDVGNCRYEQVDDDFKDDSDVFPLYRAPHPADTNLDYKELYEQMCDRCDYLDAELAKHTEKSGEPAASAEPCRAALAGSTAPVAQEPVAEVLSSRKGNDTSTIDKALPDGTKLYTAPVAAQPSAPSDTRREALLDVIRRLNSNPYSLTKSECIVEVEAMLSREAQK